MICECGSERIQWSISLTETQCPDCGGKNCQVLEEDETDEPCGSCEKCGVDLFSWNDDTLCDQCEFSVGLANGEIES